MKTFITMFFLVISLVVAPAQAGEQTWKLYEIVVLSHTESCFIVKKTTFCRQEADVRIKTAEIDSPKGIRLLEEKLKSLQNKDKLSTLDSKKKLVKKN